MESTLGIDMVNVYLQILVLGLQWVEDLAVWSWRVKKGELSNVIGDLSFAIRLRGGRKDEEREYVFVQDIGVKTSSGELHKNRGLICLR